MTNLLRVLLAGFALIGVYSAGRLSISHFHTGEACPALGPVPACYLVLFAYGAVFVCAFLARGFARRVFLIGWVPIFGLAFVGALLHTFVEETCPIDGSGVPQCYYSLGLSILLFVLGWFAFYHHQNKKA